MFDECLMFIHWMNEIRIQFLLLHAARRKNAVQFKVHCCKKNWINEKKEDKTVAYTLRILLIYTYACSFSCPFFFHFASDYLQNGMHSWNSKQEVLATVLRQQNGIFADRGTHVACRCLCLCLCALISSVAFKTIDNFISCFYWFYCCYCCCLHCMVSHYL